MLFFFQFVYYLARFEIEAGLETNTVTDFLQHTWMRRLFFASLFFGISSGLGLGVGTYTFFYAKGLSYINDNSETCANCHVMEEYLNGWLKSSHKAAAVCNDCHTPHQFIGKYWVKAMNGMHHSYAFTTGFFPDNIQITPGNRRVTEGACRHCHSKIGDQVDRFGHGPKALDCIRCHPSVGHLK